MRLGVVVVACLMAGSAGVATQPPSGQGTVTGTVSVVHKSKGVADNADVAIWLKPAGQRGPRASAPLPHVRLKITQHDKRFDPAMVVVPVGSVIDFPNLDPFFHNVFSMFDGKRFDLGLYEAGTSRSVTFTMTGVCYIFCNIHPEMSAVVVVVDTPYYAVTNRSGEFAMQHVPPGRYELFVWHDRYKPESDKEFPRELIVTAEGASTGVIRLVESAVITPHKNKYGHDYPPPAASSPVYKND